MAPSWLMGLVVAAAGTPLAGAQPTPGRDPSLRLFRGVCVDRSHHQRPGEATTLPHLPALVGGRGPVRLSGLSRLVGASPRVHRSGVVVSGLAAPGGCRPSVVHLLRLRLAFRAGLEPASRLSCCVPSGTYRALPVELPERPGDRNRQAPSPKLEQDGARRPGCVPRPTCPGPARTGSPTSSVAEVRQRARTCAERGVWRRASPARRGASAGPWPRSDLPSPPSSRPIRLLNPASIVQRPVGAARMDGPRHRRSGGVSLPASRPAPDSNRRSYPGCHPGRANRSHPHRPGRGKPDHVAPVHRRSVLDRARPGFEPGTCTPTSPD